MAKFISSLITEASGSVAGTTYSRNKNGSYIRNKSVPVNRNTLAQQAARARFSVVSSDWKTLSASEKESWEANIVNYPYVDSLGQTKYYTASQLFKSLNNSLFQLGMDKINFCVGPVSLPSILSPEVVVSQGAGIELSSITFSAGSGTEVPTGFNLAIYATTIKSTGFSSPKNSDYRFINLQLAGADVVNLDLSSAYTSVFGNSWQDVANQGNKIYFGLKLVSNITGQRNNAYTVAETFIEI